MMTRRRTSINIYDYPEHLNPFRDDVDDNSDKLNTTGRRRPSFRVNNWHLFSTSKGKQRSPEDADHISPSAASRFMTWTPKLLRKASFLRSSPHDDHNNSQLSFQRNNTRSSLPPSSLRTSLPPSTRTSLPPSTLSSPSRPLAPPSRPISPPSRPAPPPSRPAPPIVRTSLSPSRTPSTETASNSVPLPRKTLFPTVAVSQTTGDEQPREEVKYTQQGAKPKKKRRAPPPPPPSPGKTSDGQHVNSNESDASLTSSVTSNGTEDPATQEQLPKTSPDLDAMPRELNDNEKEEDSTVTEIDQNEETQDKEESVKSESGKCNGDMELDIELHINEDTSTEIVCLKNGEVQPCHNDEGEEIAKKNNSDIEIKRDENHVNHTLPQSHEIHDVNHNSQNGIMEHTNGLEEDYSQSKSDLLNSENSPSETCSRKNSSSDVDVINVKENGKIPTNAPEPKPRTILPSIPKD